MIMKVVMNARNLIATCFGPIPPAATAALVSACCLPISFQQFSAKPPPNPRKPAKTDHGCTFI